MIGPRVGPRIGPRVGIAAGVSADAIDPGGTTTVDALSGKGLPQSLSEWNTLIARSALGISAPNSLYLCQNAASPLSDSIGAFPLAISGAGDAYLQSVAGWATKACTLTDGTVGAWRTTSASLPDPAAASSLVLAYTVQPAAIPAATRPMMGIGVAIPISARINVTTGFSSIADSGSAATGATNVTGTVIPWVIKYNFTGSNCTGYTLVDKMVPTFAAGAGKAFNLGATGATGNFGFIYAARWDGASAELSDATVKLLLQALNWAPTWT